MANKDEAEETLMTIPNVADGTEVPRRPRPFDRCGICRLGSREAGLGFVPRNKVFRERWIYVRHDILLIRIVNDTIPFIVESRSGFDNNFYRSLIS